MIPCNNIYCGVAFLAFNASIKYDSNVDDNELYDKSIALRLGLLNNTVKADDDSSLILQLLKLKTLSIGLV